MGRMNYELDGIVVYNEQATFLKGKILLDNTGKILAGRIRENPGNREYYVEGSIEDASAEQHLSLNIIGVSVIKGLNDVIYLASKDYSGELEGVISIEGNYSGIRLDDMHPYLLQDKSIPLEERICSAMDKILHETEGIDKEVAISLKYIDP